MAASGAETARPGVSVGPTSEFSLFFRVSPGHGDALREALRTLQDHPGYRPGDYHMAIVTIHEARFVLFDDDTRLLFAGIRCRTGEPATRDADPGRSPSATAAPASP